ncbi:MAG: hypothetical protein K1X66_08185 [Verrucomicrobiae bacterium]|nr:hypothetical protein [Verrucomicrobiae bacterium]
MKISLTVVSLSLFMFLFTPYFVLGNPEEHEKPDSSATSTNRVIIYPAIYEAWQSIQNAADEIGDFITSTNFTPIKDLHKKISSGIEYVRTNSAQFTEEQGENLEEAWNDVEKAAINLQKAADENLVEPTKREYEELKKALKSVEIKYPKGFLHDTNGHVARVVVSEVTTVPSDFAVAAQSLEGALKVDDEAEILIQFKQRDGSPISVDDLKRFENQKIPILTVDPSLTDYHHKQLIPTKNPGEYQFSFTPKKPGPYRVWIDTSLLEKREQKFLMIDLPAESRGELITDRDSNYLSKTDGLTFALTLGKNLKVNESVLGKIKITNDKNEVVNDLEAVMDEYAHIVAFHEDYQTVVHTHPIGIEPIKDLEKTGELSFYFTPKKSGLMRIFVQARIDGEDQFARFTVLVP